MGTGPFWTDDEIKLLGTDTDAAVAKILGRTTQAVSCKRLSLGIPRSPAIDWTLDMDLALGTDSDSFVARRLGLCDNSVTLRREKLGIPKWSGSHRAKRREWTAEEDVLLGRYSTPTVARILQRSVPSVVKRQKKLGIKPGEIRIQTCVECRLQFEVHSKKCNKTCSPACHREHQFKRRRDAHFKRELSRQLETLNERIDGHQS